MFAVSQYNHFQSNWATLVGVCSQAAIASQQLPGRSVGLLSSSPPICFFDNKIAKFGTYAVLSGHIVYTSGSSLVLMGKNSLEQQLEKLCRKRQLTWAAKTVDNKYDHFWYVWFDQDPSKNSIMVSGHPEHRPANKAVISFASHCALVNAQTANTASYYTEGNHHFCHARKK